MGASSRMSTEGTSRMTQNTSVPRQTSAVQKLFACLDYLLGVDRLLILLASLSSRIDL